MKKIVHILIITFTIISVISIPNIFSESNTKQIYKNDKDAVIEHIQVVEKYRDGVSLLSKNALNDACSGGNKTDEYLKDIEYLSQQISSRSKAINSQCRTYDVSDPVLSDLLTLDIILSEYRLALLHLHQYLTSDNIDCQYISKHSFFSYTSDANKKLSVLKDCVK